MYAILSVARIHELLCLTDEIKRTEQLSHDEALGRVSDSIDELMDYADEWDRMSALTRQSA